MLGFVPTLRAHALLEMFLIDIVNVIGVPAGKDVPLSGLTVTSMSESAHAAPLALLDGLGELDALAVADGVGDGDGAAVGVGSDEQERKIMNRMMRTTSAARPTSNRRRQ